MIFVLKSAGSVILPISWGNLVTKAKASHGLHFNLTTSDVSWSDDPKLCYDWSKKKNENRKKANFHLETTRSSYLVWTNVLSIHGTALESLPLICQQKLFSLVMIDNFPTSASLSWGLPKGTILGLILFSLYMPPLGQAQAILPLLCRWPTDLFSSKANRNHCLADISSEPSCI